MAKKSGRSSNRAAPSSSSNFGGSWSPSEIELARRQARQARNKKSALIAALSSFLVLGTLGLVLVTSPGWETLRNTFFKWAYGFEILPKILLGFTTNATLTVIAGTSVALIGLGIALLRTSRSPALTPFRILATVYVDVFRGIPMLLVILLVGFGIPALQIKGLTNNVLVLGTLAVIITYSAYVSEVIRSGILTVHPSQRAAARSLGLSNFQTLRHVVLPQAIKRVTPPLLNDLVALIKDTGLVSILGVTDAVRAAQIQTAKTFNYTPYVMAAIIFLLVTIPLTRWTDRMLRNSYERENAVGQA
ncbi:MAG: amino acid ABC transporter permease [Actinobacteria bacterium]|nr:amino acid ABC transporter permease [Actinomycetota bacterium]NBP22444.1 amino acid ABC transporter permease [Actinomycetota bacterium]NBQ67073.1 amino acid ABC transporter permease [Actinomycetota bacterium]NCY10917.1 amino acid ABC transporter permease [Actinomycetota bacterium]NCZ72456.1 amino acid ABC transporter permease [Actinomycetota bacterium]